MRPDPLVIALVVLPAVAPSPAAAGVLAGTLLAALLSTVAFAAAAERWFVAALRAPMMIVGWLGAVTALQLAAAISWPAQPIGTGAAMQLLGACALLLPVTSLAGTTPLSLRWRIATRAGLSALVFAGLLALVHALPGPGGTAAHAVLLLVAAAVAVRRSLAAGPAA